MQTYKVFSLISLNNRFLTGAQLFKVDLNTLRNFNVTYNLISDKKDIYLTFKYMDHLAKKKS